jgi:DNA polymerase-3 subunit beta
MVGNVMKFSIQRESLLNALQKISSVIEKKHTMEILGNVLFEAKGDQLTLSGTDLEVGIQISLDAQIQEGGRLTLSTKNILDITKELPNQPMHFNLKPNHWVEISCAKARFNVVSISAEGYPNLPLFEEKNYNYANSERLGEMIDKTEFAVSTDATRYHLNGVYLEILPNALIRMTATDGHRLSYIDHEVFTKPIELKRGVVIPKKGLTELHKMIQSTKNIGIAFEKGYLYAKSENAFLFIRLIEADYPDYRQVIPQNLDKTAKLKREDLLGALKRVSLMAHEKSKGVKITIQDGLLSVASSNPDMGEARDEINIDYTGESFEIGFNAKYILECLEVMKDADIEFHFKDKTKPGLIQSAGHKNHCYVIMPMRI